MFERVAVLDQLALDLEQVVLGVVEQDQAARGPTRAIWRHSSEPIEPPAPVTSTTAAGQVVADALDVHPHRLAAEDVLDLDLAHLAHQAAAGLQQLEDGRHRPHRHAAVAAGARRPSRAACPGADGIAIRTSCGSTSSSTRPSSRVVPSTSSPRSMRAPCLRGSSSMKPTGR